MLKLKTLLVLLAYALLSVGACACGSSNKGTSDSTSYAASQATTRTAPKTTASGTTSTQGVARADADKDNDLGAPYDDTNNNRIVDYGHAASPADERAAAADVKRYYATAAVGNGAKACSMVVSNLAKAMAEDYGHGSAGPPYLSSATTCPAVMALVFKKFHARIAAELPKLRVTRVRLVGDHGYAILRFGILEREIAVIREGRAWKIRALLDSELP
jgi:hypothetical protein